LFLTERKKPVDAQDSSAIKRHGMFAIDCFSGEKAQPKQRRRANVNLDSGNKMSLQQPALFFQSDLLFENIAPVNAYGSNR